MSGVLYDLINFFKDFFSVILQPRNFCKVEFTDISSSGKTARKSQKCVDLSAFNQTLNHLNP